MFKLKQFCSLPVVFLLFLLIFPGIILAEETITITTYYPSPYGVYREMRAKRIAIGDTYYDAADIPWEEINGDGGLIDYLADLVVEGNVGIGTTVPTSLLDIGDTGYLTISGFSSGATTGIMPSGINHGTIRGPDGKSLAIALRDDQPTTDRFSIVVDPDGTGGPNTEVLTVRGDGYVGIGTTSPWSKFVVKSAGSPYNAGVFIGGSTAFSILPYQGIVYLSAGTYYENGLWQYYQSAGSSLFGIGETDGAHWYCGSGASYSNIAANVTLWNGSGTWIGSSSRKLKENFTQLNPDDLLNKINQLDITRWNFKSEGKKITHIGPVAEDFYHLFKTGDAEDHLATIDTAGVSLAGVKALSGKVKSQQEQIKSQQKQIEVLKLHNRQLEERLNSLEVKTKRLSK